MYGEYVKCSVGGLPSVQLGVQGVLVGLDEGCYARERRSQQRFVRYAEEMRGFL